LNDAVIIKTASDYDAVIIWMHGLGADGHDFEDVIPSLSLPENLKIKFIFPNAPIVPVTINNGYKMRAWYDITSMDIARDPDIKGIHSSAERIASWVEREIGEEILPSRILLAGFSQGGVIALELGLRFPKRLGGIIALSTYSPTLSLLHSEKSEANQKTPIFWGHGLVDEVVPFALGKGTSDALIEQGYSVDFHEYASLPHSVSLSEIQEIGAFITKVLS
jgi:phospholipase/carboxylesterase